ncbi:MAG: ring-cleaving dioxygenase, partial [Acidobacteriota bacterium]
PGFHRDEARADLGRALKLPPWLESERRRIEEMLPEVDFAEGGASEDS